MGFLNEFAPTSLLNCEEIPLSVAWVPARSEEFKYVVVFFTVITSDWRSSVKLTELAFKPSPAVQWL